MLANAFAVVSIPGAAPAICSSCSGGGVGSDGATAAALTVPSSRCSSAVRTSAGWAAA